jgi:hypothetical protein
MTTTKRLMTTAAATLLLAGCENVESYRGS